MPTAQYLLKYLQFIILYLLNGRRFINLSVCCDLPRYVWEHRIVVEDVKQIKIMIRVRVKIGWVVEGSSWKHGNETAFVNSDTERLLPFKAEWILLNMQFTHIYVSQEVVVYDNATVDSHKNP